MNYTICILPMFQLPLCALLYMTSLAKQYTSMMCPENSSNTQLLCVLLCHCAEPEKLVFIFAIFRKMDNGLVLDRRKDDVKEFLSQKREVDKYMQWSDFLLCKKKIVLYAAHTVLVERKLEP